MSGFQIPIGRGARPAYIAGEFANRHGLIAGATGTGKSVTLLTLAEGFSRIGSPAFLVDVKGDLARISATCPTLTLDVFGRTGARLSIRADSLGPDILARMFGLTEAQAGALDVVFALARQDRRPLATLADLRRLLGFAAANHRQLSARLGQVAPASVGVIQRALLALDADGSGELFGPATFDVATLLARPDRRGLVTILDARRLSETGAYGATLLFILVDLFARLPEVGDLAMPRLVLFLDEAHLLFTDMPAGLLRRVERVVRLIRSKGVGVYFASQSPADIPPVILGQLGNRIQHGLRGATLADLRAIRAAAETMPVNPAVDAAAAITRLGVGEALVSTVGLNGVPQPVDVVKVRAPDCLTAAAPINPPPVSSPAARTAGNGRDRATEARGLLLAMGAAGLAALALVEAVRAWLTL